MALTFARFTSQIEHVLRITPEVSQPLLYDLCGLNLGLIFELAVPSTSVVIQPLIDVDAIGGSRRGWRLVVGASAENLCRCTHWWGMGLGTWDRNGGGPSGLGVGTLGEEKWLLARTENSLGQRYAVVGHGIGICGE